ncbi:MAG: cob(I)yrinic acid a,c-diamide adenosyltransferase [Bacteroidales bacterium]|nr:cob(I)yrinic acid a,c-diamide adenosyltransferase [Bacteroidales bacterium]
MGEEFKIYTKTGDKGTTALIGGKRVPKYHIRIEAYGTVDELNSFIGLIRDQEVDSHSREILIEIQDRLFTLESQLAKESDENLMHPLPELHDEDVTLLEKEIDAMNEELPELTSFVLPGGHPTVSYCHVARTVCRRAERLTIRLNEEFSLAPINIQYLNRLSDFLFVLARKFTKDFDAPESLWKPRI